jgi:hypothetical protein
VEGSFLSAIVCTRFDDVKESEIWTAEPLAPEPSDIEFAIAVEKLERHTNHEIFINSQQNCLKQAIRYYFRDS